jgi:serine/threonine-protein kinase
MRTRLAFTLACGLALSVSAAPAMAELYGAIAFSPSTGQYGWAKNQSVEAGASDEALSGCGVADCQSVVVFASCAAISVGDGYGMGFSKAKSVSKAEDAALAKCDEFTTNCIVSASVCNDE